MLKLVYMFKNRDFIVQQYDKIFNIHSIMVHLKKFHLFVKLFMKQSRKRNKIINMSLS